MIEGLDEEERARLDRGEHEQVARALEAAGRRAAAARVRELIWDFARASQLWLLEGALVDAIRTAIESASAASIDAALTALESRGTALDLRTAAELLERRRRHHEAARLLARLDDGPDGRAQALLRAGDRLAAAQVYAAAGRPLDALRALGELGTGPTAAAGHALAVELAWDLGDAEASARHAQQAIRGGLRDDVLTAKLARALVALGHDLAAELVRPRQSIGAADLPARFHVTGLHSAGLFGAAYVGVDRTSMREVEIHLLLDGATDGGTVDPQVRAAFDRFCAVAIAAAASGHPAIRPVLELQAETGLLVLPRSNGSDLRSLIRAPGLGHMPSRARALVAFLLEGLIDAHTRGLVHGWLLPSQIVCDAVGRPMLGPFGAHHLAGMAATQTGSLEEILAVTAPEVRQGQAPAVESDIYAIGALLAALLVGELLPEPIGNFGPLGPWIARACAQAPSDRPGAAELLAVLRVPVSEIHELGSTAAPSTSFARPQTAGGNEGVQISLEVEAAATWPDSILDALCASGNPWWQPILDRERRRLVLAAWPPSARVLGSQAPENWRELVPPSAITCDDAQLAAAIAARLRPSSLVVTAGGTWMLALDDLLTR